MSNEQRATTTAVQDACASVLTDAGRICDPVERLVVLAEIADRLAAALRDVEAATSQAVRQALTTMTIDDLSARLNQSPQDILFLPGTFAGSPPATDHSSNGRGSSD